MISPALIDFDRQCPEAIRGVPARARETYNWDALGMLIEHTAMSDATQLQKARWRKDLLASVRKNGIECMAPAFRYNYVRARLALGDFSDYWGWEFRDAGANGEQWSAHLYWEETWLAKWGIVLPFEGHYPGAGPIGKCERLLILGEQGVGDAIFIASMLPEALLRCREVIFECDERLHSLFERSFPGLKCRSERPFEDRRADYGQIDAFVPAFELMRMFRQDIRNEHGRVLSRGRDLFPGKPYLVPDPERVREFEKYRGRTGVAWKGRQGSIDLLKLEIDEPLSVQYREFHREIEQAEVDLWSDIEGVVALCSVLKKVVTVPQSVHHMAAAVGTKVEIIMPEVLNEQAINKSHWDYPTLYNGGRIIWYPNAQVFRNVRDWKRGLRP